MLNPAMSVTALFLLSSLAITALAQSCSKPVGNDNMNLKGEYISKDSFEDGSSVSFACSTGYTAAGGSASITCSSGKWSPLTLRCERKNCGAFKDVPNGDVNYPDGGTLFTDTAEITCKPGYILVGKNKTSCGVQGWMDRAPVCEVVKCPPPGNVANGYFQPMKETYSFSEAVTYKCEDDFALSGAKELTCSKDEKFQPGLPKCIKVECKDPEIANAEFVAGSRPPHKHSATVTFKCKPDYYMSGQPTLTCNINSQWSPGIPKCIKKDKNNPGGSANAIVGGPIGGLVVSMAVLWLQHFWM